MPYRICSLNLPFTAIFVESYECAPKEDNYLMKILVPYLKFFHYFGLNVPMFVELYPFGANKNMMLGFKHCLKNAPWHVLLVFVKITQHLLEVVQIFSFILSLQFFFGFSNLIDLYGQSISGLSQLLFFFF